MIVSAFKWAAAVRPDLRLCLNDYDLLDTDRCECVGVWGGGHTCRSVLCPTLATALPQTQHKHSTNRHSVDTGSRLSCAVCRGNRRQRCRCCCQAPSLAASRVQQGPSSPVLP